VSALDWMGGGAPLPEDGGAMGEGSGVRCQVKVKICGVVDPENARLAVELGADFLGLNFYPASPRFVDAARAREIADAVRGRVPLVGVFVNAAPSEIAAIVDSVGLDLVQLSGDEDEATVGLFAGRAIKVFRTGGDPGAAALAPFAETWGLLFDAPSQAAGGLYGGTGVAWGYETAARIARRLSGRRVFLAGGIGPDNVRQALAVVRPYAVDVCSRVEKAPGIKDPELLRRLFQEVQHAQAPPAP
jgi:phosphoribosylanthranilate isomerase